MLLIFSMIDTVADAVGLSRMLGRRKERPGVVREGDGNIGKDGNKW